MTYTTPTALYFDDTLEYNPTLTTIDYTCINTLNGQTVYLGNYPWTPFTSASGTNPPTSGTIGVIISAATSSNLTFATAKYDLELTSGTTVTRLIEGDVQLSKEVTR